MSKNIFLRRKNKLLKSISQFLIIAILAISVFPTNLRAETLREQRTPKLQHFIVSKEWKNDLASQRPSITINVIDKDAPETVIKSAVLNSGNNWQQPFTLPAYKTNETTGETEEIVYEVYESETGLDKYQIGSPSDNPLVITKKIIIDDNSRRNIETSPFTVTEDTTLFNTLSMGNIIIDSNLPLEGDDVTRELTGNFTYVTDVPKYTHPYDKKYSIISPMIVYTGNLVVGDNDIDGSIVLTYEDKATDYLTRQQYDVQIIVDNITINSLVPANGKRIAVMNYDKDEELLNMQAFVTTFDDDEIKGNVVGVSADIEIRVLGVPNGSFTQAYITDLDVGDYVKCYGTYNDDPEDHMGEFHNLTDDYAESVSLIDGVASDVYLIDEGDTRLISNGVKFVDGTGSNDSYSTKNTLKFIASASSYKFRWAGSKCGTSIMAVNPEEIPIALQYTNTITNTSSFYMSRYYFQNDDGTYNKTPSTSDPAEMIRPGSKVSVENNSKTKATDVDSTKTGYVLDESEGRTDKTTKRTVTIDNTQTNPLILDVYFKKAYTVKYHDSVNNTVWKVDDQTNTPLDYDSNTPPFTGTVDEEGNPLRLGYKFLGWSKTEGGKIEDIPPKVTGDADYWAHWEALPNKYIVQYFYEVNGIYPITPDYFTERNDKKTDELASITETDKIPNAEKPNYYLNSNMTTDWEKPVAGDGSTILKVYFKQRQTTIKIPVTGIK